MSFRSPLPLFWRVFALLALAIGLFARPASAQAQLQNADASDVFDAAPLASGPLNVVLPTSVPLDGGDWFAPEDAGVDAAVHDAADASAEVEDAGFVQQEQRAEPAPVVDPAAVIDLTPGDVRVRDRVIMVLRAAREGQGPQARARVATQRITALLAHVADLGPAHVETRPTAGGTEATLSIGTTAILTIGKEDADAAGETSVEAYAEASSNAMAEAVAAEKTRSAVANTVFRLSLLVFTGLVLFLLFSRVGSWSTRLRHRFAADETDVSDLAIGKLQVLSAGSVRVLLSAGITFGYRAIQVLLGLGWLLFGLSLFERTRPWTEQLTGVMLTPFSSIATRVASGMPLLVLLAIGGFALSVLLRVTGLFFDSVARGETRVDWLPRELAKPSSVAARGGLVIASLALIAPMITGDDDGIAARAATIALASVGFALLPSLASAAFGAPLVFSRRLRKNDYVEVGRHTGRVREVGLLELRLEDDRGAEVRVPHLYAFFHPLRILGGAPTVDVDLVVAADSDLVEVESKLHAAARKLTGRAEVRLLSLDADGARFRVTSVSKSPDRGTLTAALAGALKDAGIKLGKRTGGG